VFIDVLSAMGAIKACIPHCLSECDVSVCRGLRVLVLVLSVKTNKKGWKNV
jgi:hypothetical protein